ncbi:hypothetical protein CHUAL_008707 [Chamberlinius hualienensis]
MPKLILCFLFLVALATAISMPADKLVARYPGYKINPVRACSYVNELIPDRDHCELFYNCAATLYPMQMKCPKYTCFYDGMTYCDWERF